MAVSPTQTAQASTDFYIDVLTFSNSVHGIAIIDKVNLAASTGGTVTNAEWNEFIVYTSWRYKIFEQHNNLT